MRFTKEEALEMAKPAPELLAAKVPAEAAIPWADIPRLRALIGLEGDKARLGELMPEVEEFDLEVTFRDGHKMPGRVFRPIEIPAEGSPLMVAYHGGGWASGSYLQSAVGFRRLAKLFKMVVVSLPYRLAPENPFPTPQYDAYDGLKLVARNAQDLKANLSKGFIVSGGSAGAQLAAVCGQHWVREKQSPPLTGSYYQIAWILAPSQVPEKYKEFYNSPYQEEIKHASVLTTDDLLVLDAHLKPDYKSEWHSPFVAANPHEGMPPAYFQLCGQDPLRDHSLIYEDALKEAGVKTKLDVYPGLFHGFPVFLPNIPQVVKMLNDQVKGVAFLLGKSDADIHRPR